LITGASDDDPSGIGTYSIVGASSGYSMLWVALVTTPMMAVVSGTCARIGMVTGAGLMRALARSMPPRLAVALAALVMLANTYNIGADMAAMAASAHMLLPIPLPVWITGFALVIAGVEIFFSYRAFAQVVKWLCASLLAYLVTAVIVHPPWLEILWNTLIPHVRPNGRWLTMLVGALGTTITPYLFFWQTSMMVEEKRDAGRSRLAQRLGATPKEIQSAHADVNTGAIYSNSIMFFIIVTSAATLGAHGATGIDGAQQAALALRPLAGNFAYALFALGIVGTGLLAIPVLAGSSAYMFSELYGLAEGLSLRPLRARGFYGVILCGVGAGTLMALLRVNPLGALFWSAVFNGIAAVPLVYAILRLAHDPAVLGRWTVSRAASIWLWLTFSLMLLAAAGMVVSWFFHA
jgi:Mn2+/Fe2+ NRAMP family transporter